MEIFIDESGNLGKKDRFFIIAMLRPNNKKRIKNFLKSFIVKNNVAEVHGTLLSFKDKQNLVFKLVKSPDHCVSYIVADKQHLMPKLLKDKNICFNYLFMHLVKKTIMNCRESVDIFVDEHTIKVSSINSLSDYIKIKAYTDWNFKNEIKINFVDSKSHFMIQATDLIANVIYGKYTYQRDHLYKRLNIVEPIKFPFDKFGV